MSDELATEMERVRLIEEYIALGDINVDRGAFKTEEDRIRRIAEINLRRRQILANLCP